MLPRAKRYARSRGVSLSSLIEDALREMADPDRPSFTAKWRGRFVPSEKGDERYRALAAFVAWHTAANFFYLVRPMRGAESARDFFVELTGFVSVAPADTESLRYAASLALPDLEGAMQVAAARACGAQYIATRNVKDFKKSPVPARTPAELVEELG